MFARLAGKPGMQPAVAVTHDEVARPSQRRLIEAPAQEIQVACRNWPVAGAGGGPKRGQALVRSHLPLPLQSVATRAQAQAVDGIQRPARRRSQQCRYPEAMRVVAMAQHARVPRQLAEWRVADAPEHGGGLRIGKTVEDRKSTRLNSSH